MKILSVSTATNHLSVALNEDEKIISEKNERDERNHSEHLDPIIQKILQENKVQLAQIDRFAVAIGPGSYTGLRIGITTVKMFASVLNKEVVGISTLQALAEAIKEQKTLIVAGLDARNENYFAGGYLLKQGEPHNVIPDGHYHIDALLKAVKRYWQTHSLQKVVFVGSGFHKQEAAIEQIACPYVFASEEQNEVHAGLIGQLALTAAPIDPDKLLPRYLRRTQAEVEWHKKTGKPYGPDSQYVEEV